MSHIPRFDLVDLRLFSMVAEGSSLTRGAERACLSVAAASLRIKSLEEGVGAQLLYRNKRGMSLTSAGEMFLEHALSVLAEVEKLQVALQPFSSGIQGHVRLFANPTAISEFLPAVLAKFFEIHSRVTLDLQERLSAEVVRAVHDGVADIGVISAGVAVDGLETFPYKKDKMVLVVPKNHPLAEFECTSFADTLEYEFIGLNSHSTTYTYLQKEVLEYGRSMLQRVQVGSYDAMCRMIQAGVGIGIMPEMVARRHENFSEINIIYLSNEWATRELRICVRKKEDLPIFTRELIDFILKNE